MLLKQLSPRILSWPRIPMELRHVLITTEDGLSPCKVWFPSRETIPGLLYCLTVQPTATTHLLCECSNLLGMEEERHTVI